jgi:hypothetical protein
MADRIGMQDSKIASNDAGSKSGAIWRVWGELGVE